MRRPITALLAFAALFALAPVARVALADGRQVHYVGIHPLPKSEGGGMCYIEGPHVHIFDADKLQYRDHEGASYFVGDPVAYGYDGPRYVYKGHHPIPVTAVVGYGAPQVEYCYIDGPHYHYFAPPEGPEWRVAGNTYFYVGEPPHAYIEARPAMMRINAVYQPLVYERPVVAVEAPIGWIGARAEFVGPGVVVETPRAAVEAVVPAPGVRVGVGVGVGIGVGVGVGVGVATPGVVVREHPGAVIVRERPVVIHERPVVVHERPVVIEERKHEAGRHR